MTGDLVLALDTATDRLTVAVLRVHGEAAPYSADEGKGLSSGVEVLAEVQETAGRSTSKRLLIVVEDALGQAGAGLGSVGAVVVGVGPGTFTGVRISVAVARALSLALDVPVFGVPTLSALAADGAAAVDGRTSIPAAEVAPASPAASDRKTAAAVPGALLDLPAVNVDALVPVVDARRGQVFAGVYRRAADGLWARDEPYRALTMEALAVDVASRVDMVSPALVGDSSLLAAVDCAGRWSATLALDVRAAALLQGQDRLREPGNAPLGDRLEALISHMIYGGWKGGSRAGRVPGAPGTPESVVPLYVRPPDADEHITRMRDPFAS